MTPSLKRFKIACTSFPISLFHFYFPKCNTYVTTTISTFSYHDILIPGLKLVKFRQIHTSSPPAHTISSLHAPCSSDETHEKNTPHSLHFPNLFHICTKSMPYTSYILLTFSSSNTRLFSLKRNIKARTYTHCIFLLFLPAQQNEPVYLKEYT